MLNIFNFLEKFDNASWNCNEYNQDVYINPARFLSKIRVWVEVSGTTFMIIILQTCKHEYMRYYKDVSTLKYQ